MFNDVLDSALDRGLYQFAITSEIKNKSEFADLRCEARGFEEVLAKVNLTFIGTPFKGGGSHKGMEIECDLLKEEGIRVYIELRVDA
jgi:hypothetical protein